VASFHGDNGGATYQGVSANTVRILVYLEGGGGKQTATSQGDETTPPGGYCEDLDKPPPAKEFVWDRMMRLYSIYFNQRYQTYNRHADFVDCYSSYFSLSNGETPSDRAADAAQFYERVHPFATLNQASYGYATTFSDAVAQKGVLVFRGAQNERTPCCTDASVYSGFPGLLWSVAASTDEYARMFIDYVCKRILGHPVSFTGNATDQAGPRKLGLILDKWPDRPELARFGQLVQNGVQACGGSFAYVGSTDENQQNPQLEARDIAGMKQQGVTTVIWPGGSEVVGNDNSGLYMSQSGGNSGYLPEVVIAGTGGSDITLEAAVQNQGWESHVLAVTTYTRADVLDQTPCFQAAREVNANAPTIDIENFGCTLYDNVRLLFTGLQVAGPRLHPTTVDQGFHAIPPVQGNDPHAPSCFFDGGEYTCVKDAAAAYWDPSGHDPGGNSSQGCWRILEGGRRYIAGHWPNEDAAANRNPASDPCNHMGLTLS
jgi:hypothetical protein